MNFKIVFLCKTSRARIVRANVRFFAGMCANVNGKLGSCFECFVAFIAGLRNFLLWLWSAFLLLLRHFFDVSITVPTPESYNVTPESYNEITLRKFV